MSGVVRSILAEQTRKGAKGEAVQASLSPANILKEKGISNNTSTASGSDGGKYLGKNGKDARK